MGEGLLSNLPKQIETERLIIKKFEKNEGKDLLDLLQRNDNRSFLKEHVDEATDIQNEVDAEKRVQELSDFWAKRERFVMGIWLKKTNLFIGNIWIEPKNWKVPSFELGYYLDKGYIGQGFASEAARKAIQFIFENLSAYKIIIITSDTNVQSYKLAERLGFEKEGHLKECNIEEDKRFGLLYYGLFRKDWKLSKKN
ncbi:MAG: N-acetyltransferase [Candidatus Heimdallarchaeota archaeon]|nr:N-acetyltransferase [Candidatus Heimdallarchaeota archaeon]